MSYGSDVALVGFSIGGREVARHLGTYGAKKRVSNAVSMAAVPLGGSKHYLRYELQYS